MTGVYSTVIALAVVVALFAIITVAMLRSHAEILRRLDRLGVRLEDEDGGAPLTLSATRTVSSGDLGEIRGVSPDGDQVATSPVLGTQPVLLAFLSTTCSSCTMFWEEFDDTTISMAGRPHRLLVVTLGADEESPTRARSLARGNVDVIMSSEAWNDYEVPGAPYFVLVDPVAAEKIGEGTAATVAALHTFLSDAASDRVWDQVTESLSDRSDADRERMIDDELRRAGILPGDPSLYPPEDDHDEP